ncbi:unnamed protein product [Urochloa humidicola]
MGCGGRAQQRGGVAISDGRSGGRGQRGLVEVVRSTTAMYRRVLQPLLRSAMLPPVLHLLFLELVRDCVVVESEEGLQHSQFHPSFAHPGSAACKVVDKMLSW